MVDSAQVHTGIFHKSVSHCIIVDCITHTPAYEAVQDLTPEVVPRCCKNSSSELIQKKIEKYKTNPHINSFSTMCGTIWSTFEI